MKQKIQRKVKYVKTSWKQESPENKLNFWLLLFLLGSFISWLVSIAQ